MPVVHLAAPTEQTPRLPVVVRLGLAELLLLSDRCGHPRRGGGGAGAPAAPRGGGGPPPGGGSGAPPPPRGRGAAGG